jgi:hypothetical protein
MRPTAAYFGTTCHTLTTQSYAEFSKELDIMIPSSVSTSISCSILYDSLYNQCHEYHVFEGYLSPYEEPKLIQL